MAASNRAGRRYDHGLSQRDLPMAVQEGPEAGSFLKEDVWFGADVIVLKKARESRAAQWWRLALWSPMMCHFRRVSDLREPVREFE
jgi:hypothetical protein